MLFDRRSGHSNYFHHQTELLAKALWFFRDVYKPHDKKWKNVQFLIPPGVLLHLQVFNTDDLFLNMPTPEQIIQWSPNDRYYIKEYYTVGWTAPDIDLTSTGVLGDQSFVKFAQPVWNVHFPPRALLRLTHEAMRSSIHVHEYDHLGFGGRTRDPLQQEQVKIVWYSRKDTEKRHVVGEKQIIQELKNTFGQYSVEVFAGGISFDVQQNMKVFGSADVVVGPHGAGLANLLMCKKDTSLVLLPTCDAVGCPSSSDSYFGYLAAALDFGIVGVKKGPTASFFGNYTLGKGEVGVEQVDAVVDAVEEVLVKRGLWGGVGSKKKEL